MTRIFVAFVAIALLGIPTITTAQEPTTAFDFGLVLGGGVGGMVEVEHAFAPAHAGLAGVRYLSLTEQTSTNVLPLSSTATLTGTRKLKGNYTEFYGLYRYYFDGKGLRGGLVGIGPVVMSVAATGDYSITCAGTGCAGVALNTSSSATASGAGLRGTLGYRWSSFTLELEATGAAALTANLQPFGVADPISLQPPTIGLKAGFSFAF